MYSVCSLYFWILLLGFKTDTIKATWDQNAMCKCSSISLSSYKTYDGPIVGFRGNCRYLLTELPAKPQFQYTTFAVWAKYEQKGWSTTVYLDSLEFHIEGTSVLIEIEDCKPIVTVNGYRRPLPCVINSRLFVHGCGGFIRIMTTLGVLVSWNAHGTLTIDVPDLYRAHLRGICGNCNGLMDEFILPAGANVTADDEKGAIIAHAYGTHTNGFCRTEGENVGCSGQILEEVSSTKYCGLMRNNSGSPFQQCILHDVEAAMEYFHACVYDVCADFDDEMERTKVACSAVESFASYCLNIGFNVRWRTQEFCPLECGENMRYVEHVNMCPPTCAEPNATDVCEVSTVDGCECIPNFVLSDGKCTHIDECGCTTENGDIYPLGETLHSDDCTQIMACMWNKSKPIFEVVATQTCHENAKCKIKRGQRKCVCNRGYGGNGVDKCEPLCGGRYKCHENADCKKRRCVCKEGFYGNGRRCVRACQCSATGDPHYHMFDGKTIHFQGVCKYILVQRKSTECPFSVEVKNERRRSSRRVSFTRLVDIKFPGITVRFAKRRKFYVNGKLEYTPYDAPDRSFSVFLQGKSLILESKCKVYVSFNGESVVNVIVPKRVGNELSGLCGNCNGKKDDFRLRNGTDVSHLPRNQKFVLIGESYEVPDDSDKPNRKCETEEVDSICDTEEVKAKAESNKFCGLLTDISGPFAECLAVAELREKAAEHFESCMFDVCEVIGEDEDVAVDLACNAVEALSELCQSNGFEDITWRSETFCPITCGPNQVYNSSITDPPPTCLDQLGKTGVSAGPTEGCVCKEGFLLNGEECVPFEQCGCRYEGKYYPLGFELVSSDCSTSRRCVVDNGVPAMKVVTSGRVCHSDAQCRLTDGLYWCVCNTGFEGDGIICKPKPNTCDGWVIVQCSSWGFKYTECQVTLASQIKELKLKTKYSKSDCVSGTSFGFKGGKVWVDKGCRAAFEVCYKTDRYVYLITPNRYFYQLLNTRGVEITGHFSLRFGVQSCSEAYMLLMENFQETDSNVYEIALGIHSNYVSAIRLSKQGSNVKMIKHSQPLFNCDVTRYFWISWFNNYVRVGSGWRLGQNEFLSYFDQRKFQISYVAVASGDATTGFWTFYRTVSTTCDGVSVVKCDGSQEYKECVVRDAMTVLSVKVRNQLTRAACIFGSSYGMKENKIWVSKGCYASFDACYKRHSVLKGVCENKQNIKCGGVVGTVDKYKVTRCKVPLAAQITGVRLLRQLCTRDCKFGTSYGIDGPYLWTRMGCYAEFEVCFYQDASECGAKEDVTCNGSSSSYKSCQVTSGAQITRLTLKERMPSCEACKYASTYGRNSSNIWVKEGCRAKFETCYKTVPVLGNAGFCRYYTFVQCQSTGWRYNRCSVPPASEITYIDIVHRFSTTECELNHNYGVESGDVWVDKGCRARFVVCYKPGGHYDQECVSQDYKWRSYNSTVARKIHYVSVLESRGDTSCILGYSYGWKDSSVWVNFGCKASMRIFWS